MDKDKGWVDWNDEDTVIASTVEELRDYTEGEGTDTDLAEGWLVDTYDTSELAELLLADTSREDVLDMFWKEIKEGEDVGDYSWKERKTVRNILLVTPGQMTDKEVRWFYVLEKGWNPAALKFVATNMLGDLVHQVSLEEVMDALMHLDNPTDAQKAVLERKDGKIYLVEDTEELV